MFDILFIAVVLIFSVMIHEIAHGSVALALGDTTAKNQGRLSLNPLKHLDIFGSIILPGALLLLYSASGQVGPIIGWAKPVPINPFNFKDKKWGELKVSLAGPAANFLIALFFCLILRFSGFFSAFLPINAFHLFSQIAFYNLILVFFNLVPIPPLDGSHILFSFFGQKLIKTRIFLEQYSLLVFAFVFFILPGLSLISYLSILIYNIIVGS
jgi:Zn-dependent protease